MTRFNPCVVIDFPLHKRLDASRLPTIQRPGENPKPNLEAEAILAEAERLTDHISDCVQAGICNAGAGRATDRLGVIVDGATLARAAMLSLELVKLRTLASLATPADAALTRALEEWLYQRGNGNA